ncbi:TlpA family protein disulfide reductase [candidate division KSB1 bacterium]|nr:TlpA family protein disulfide reductase [candidate division KSB1 bacterium]
MKNSFSNNSKRWIISSVLAITALLTLVIFKMHAQDFPDVLGKQAPEWTLENLEGKKINTTDFKGKVQIIDLWATWCPPCRKGIPELMELQEKYKADGLEIIGIALDNTIDPVKEFATTTKFNYTVVFGNRKIANLYGRIEAIPTTFIVDKTGKVVKKLVGYQPKSVFEEELKPLLGK